MGVTRAEQGRTRNADCKARKTGAKRCTRRFVSDCERVSEEQRKTGIRAEFSSRLSEIPICNT